ncbi:MAG: class II aldolase/adducin family protein [Alphaproteobacteria bacterium]|nr:class II aldolase/adducin family protein [Alphaproteobacteria bacterium]
MAAARKTKGKTNGKKPKMSPEEWQTRVNLAACYRLVALNGMTDLDATHISARAPHNPEHFFLNPFGMLFHEITASSLVKLDLDGNIVEENEYGLNPAGVVIHSAVLRGRPDVASVVHTHTRAGMAVSAQKDGLLPLTQTSLRFYGKLAYHDYEGIAEPGEEERLVEHLSDKPAMILRNHGLLATGRTVPEAYLNIHELEHACQAQIDAQSGGNANLLIVPKDVCESTAQQYIRFTGNKIPGERAWPAHLRTLDRADSSYKT